LHRQSALRLADKKTALHQQTYAVVGVMPFYFLTTFKAVVSETDGFLHCCLALYRPYSMPNNDVFARALHVFVPLQILN
jgi:hypothetical protein